MCGLAEIKIGDRCIEVADIKKEYIENIIRSVSLCNAIEKVVLFGSALGQHCTETSDVDIAIFGKYPKSKMYRLRSYNEFVDSVISYGELQDYDMLYYYSEDKCEDVILQDIRKGETLFERM